jgi:hypothetical protein
VSMVISRTLGGGPLEEGATAGAHAPIETAARTAIRHDLGCSTEQFVLGVRCTV